MRKEVYICYLDEQDKKRDGIVILISKTSSTLTFKTKLKQITIPINRLIKLKEDIRGDNNEM